MTQVSQETAAAILRAMLILGGATLLTDLILLVVWFLNKERESEGEKPILAPRWSLVDVFLGGQLIVLLTFGAGFFLLGMYASHSTRALDPSMMNSDVLMRAIIIPGTIFQNLFTAGVVFAFVRYRYGIRIREFLIGARPWRALGIGLAVGIPLVSLVIAADQLGWMAPLEHALRHTHVGRIFQELQETMDATSLVQSLTRTRSGFFWALLTVGIFAPIGEEIFFRGFLFRALDQRFGLVAGVLVSSLIFAAIHLQVVNFLPMLLLAMVLAYGYARTKSLLTPIVIHALNNTAVIILVSLNLLK